MLENQTEVQAESFFYRKRIEGQQNILFLLRKTASFNINYKPKESFVAHAYFGKRAAKDEGFPRYTCQGAALADAVDLRHEKGPDCEITIREFHKGLSLSQAHMSTEEWTRLDHDTRELPDPPEPRNWEIAGDGQIIELVQSE